MRSLFHLICTIAMLLLATLTTTAADPGVVVPQRHVGNDRLAAASDQKQASVLVYNFYSSNFSDSDGFAPKVPKTSDF